MQRKYKFKEHELDKLFFTSDTHFGHGNIIQYECRPFIDTYDMDAGLIRRWNNTVPEDGTIFVLGDFCWQKKGFFESLDSQLNGKKIYIKGNHDHGKEANNWPYVVKLNIQDSRIVGGNTVIVCSHCPFETWEQQVYGSWHLHGHVHTREFSEKKRRYNVGVDVNYYAPISYNEIRKEFKKLKLS